MRHILCTALFPILLGCSPGTDGLPGAPGSAGQDGAPGKDAAQDGSRLTARWLVGEDGSRMFHGDWIDTERGEVCAFREHDGQTLCLPPILEATAWNTYVDPGCSGDYGFVGLFAPAGSEGSSLVRVLGGLLDGELLMRGEEVAELWTDGSGLPCQPATPSDGFPPPYYHWPLFDSAAFVAGEVE